MDHNGEKSTGSTDRSREYPEVVSPEMSSTTGLKCCEICRTTKTPLWRGGPSGPKSVCNACGIRYRKKRREILGLSTAAKKPKKENKSVVRLLEFGTDLLRKRRSLLPVKRRRRLAEEEEAAVLLMALSSGLLYA